MARMAYGTWLRAASHAARWWYDPPRQHVVNDTSLLVLKEESIGYSSLEKKSSDESEPSLLQILSEDDVDEESELSII